MKRKHTTFKLNLIWSHGPSSLMIALQDNHVPKIKTVSAINSTLQYNTERLHKLLCSKEKKTNISQRRCRQTIGEARVLVMQSAKFLSQKVYRQAIHHVMGLLPSHEKEGWELQNSVKKITTPSSTPIRCTIITTISSLSL